MTREELTSAVAEANVPTLLMVLVQLTGDLRWLEPPFTPTAAPGVSDNDTGGLPEDVQQTIRSAAVEAILKWRADGVIGLADPDVSTIVRMMSVSVGERVQPEYGPMLADDLHAPYLTTPGAGSGVVAAQRVTPEAPDDDLDVVVIGAGISGICAAVYLGQAGFSYSILEAADRVGGTWRDNRYPAAAVDTPSHLYSFSFAPHDWPRFFATQEQILEYLEETAETLDIVRHIQFKSRVKSAAFDPVRNRWTVEVETGGGPSRTVTAKVLLSAVGAFDPPKVPAIPGLSEFQGESFHTAHWPDGYQIENRDVAVIGNGASAMQVVPAIAPKVRSLRVFQRSPHWVAPFEKFQRAVPEGVRRLMLDVPMYTRWYRLRLGWLFNDRLYPLLRRDPEWPHPERAMNAGSDRYRRFLTDYITSELGDRQDLLAQVVPTYPPGGKRLLLDNGWYRTLQRNNVELVSTAITSVDGDAVCTADGGRYEVDTIVMATGFEAARFLSGIDVRGRHGQLLSDVWEGDNGKAYLGTSVPGFPNFFVLYGPNSQTGHGGSLISLVEAQAHYVVTILEQMRDAGVRTFEIRQDIFDAYNDEVDTLHEDMVWTHPGMTTYYRNSRGRVVVATPFRAVDLWHRSRRADVGDYVTDASAPMNRAPVVRGGDPDDE